MSDKKGFWDFADENAGCLIPAAVIIIFLIFFLIEDLVKILYHQP